MPTDAGRRTARLRRIARALTASAFGLVALGAWEIGRENAAEAKEPKGRFEHGCRVQKPQKFLERRSFHKKGRIDPLKHAKAVRWLVERYGNVEDEATTKLNPQSAR